jgi:hypothetical protein
METLRPGSSVSQNPIQKITDGDRTYTLKGSKLLISENGKIRVIDLRRKFAEKGIDPLNAEMRKDSFPPKMKRKGSLLYFYSPGASHIVVVSPQTGRKPAMAVTEKTRQLRSVEFEVKNGIIALTGPGADFLVIIGLGDLMRDEVYPLEIDLMTLFSMTARLKDPKIEIRGGVYIRDEALGKSRYFFEVKDGVPSDQPVRVR